MRKGQTRQEIGPALTTARAFMGGIHAVLDQWRCKALVPMPVIRTHECAQ